MPLEFYTPNWETLSLDEREKLIVLHARHYAKNFATAGIPGSNHIMLIAKLAGLLDEAHTYAKEVEEPFAVEDTSETDDTSVRKPSSSD